MSKPTPCWTCRLRKKKCDKRQPICNTCNTLEISCYYSETRPEWMDGGKKQSDMVENIKATVKQAAEARRERQYIQVLSLHPGQEPRVESVDESVIPDSIDPMDIEVEPTVQPENQLTKTFKSGLTFESTSSNSPNPPEIPNQFYLDSADIMLPCPLSINDIEADFAMTYLDYVFPYLFPFCRPSIFEGGRAWLLVMLKSNKALFHTAMCLSTYFSTLVQSEQCRLYVWGKLGGHMEIAIKTMQEDIEGLRTGVIEGTVPNQARVMESAVQLLVFEIAMSRTAADWNAHLAAAVTLFVDMFERHGVGEDGEVDIGLVISKMERHIWTVSKLHVLGATKQLDYGIWNTDQGAFRFSAAILLCADIVSSTVLETPPQLQKYHEKLIAPTATASITICHKPPNMQEFLSLNMEEFVGCQGWALITIGEIAQLDALKKKGEISHVELILQGEEIARKLREGFDFLNRPQVRREKKRSNILKTYNSYDYPAFADEYITATRIWAHAAEIYLYIVVSGWQPSHPKILENVEAALLLLEGISSPATLHSLVWPLCVTGCLAGREQEDRFRDVVSIMGPLEKFGTVGDALMIMEKVWRRREGLDAHWNLAACFKILGMSVLLM